ncbi:interleukin-17 receptor C isoform X2 [Dermochelys coriacea]|uniref:interleukin-17 receptor C isoform X2 n=1 Tax=Dermochelys coriacea TaxID=27794 RepID=UPI001CA8455B|nr:interleukin-17 receptor C isoform X2 [Dermochelys coriacea]
MPQPPTLLSPAVPEEQHFHPSAPAGQQCQGLGTVTQFTTVLQTIPTLSQPPRPLGGAVPVLGLLLFWGGMCQGKGFSLYSAEADVLCSPGAVGLASGPVLVPTQMRMESVLHCPAAFDCSPCVKVELQLAVLGPQEEVAGKGNRDGPGMDALRHQDSGPLRSWVLLSVQTYPSSRCVALEVQLPRTLARPNHTVGSLWFHCFEAVLRGELHITSYTSPRYREVLSQMHRVPVPRLHFSVGPEHMVVQLQDVNAGQNFTMWFYWNQTSGLKGLRTERGPQNYSLPSAQLLPCLCLQVWPDIPDPPRTSRCPFTQDPTAWTRLWAQAQLKLRLTAGRLSCSVSVPCAVPAELVPCWRLKRAGPCHELPHLRQALTLPTLHEFGTLQPHPNLCVQVWSGGRVQLMQCLLEGVMQGQPADLLLMETRDPQGNMLLCAMERGTCIPLASSTCMGVAVGALEPQLQRDVQSGQCLQVWHAEGSVVGTGWACSLEKYLRAHWALAWMGGLLSTFCILLLLLLKKENLKGWLKMLKEDYSSGGVLRGRRALILYSPDHASFERLVSTLACALTRLQLAVSVELWSRAELCAIGPMQWFHAQRLRVLQEGGTVVLLFSRGAVARCTEWLLWKQGERLPRDDPYSAFSASLNCVLPDFLAGKAGGRYLVACFEDLLRPADVPELFRSVPIFTLPSQLPTFLLALAGTAVGREQKSGLKKHSLWIGDSLQRAIRECQLQKPDGHCPAQAPTLPGGGQVLMGAKNGTGELPPARSST